MVQKLFIYSRRFSLLNQDYSPNCFLQILTLPSHSGSPKWGSESGWCLVIIQTSQYNYFLRLCSWALLFNKLKNKTTILPTKFTVNCSYHDIYERSNAFISLCYQIIIPLQGARRVTYEQGRSCSGTSHGQCAGCVRATGNYDTPRGAAIAPECSHGRKKSKDPTMQASFFIIIY